MDSNDQGWSRMLFGSGFNSISTLEICRLSTIIAWLLLHRVLLDRGFLLCYETPRARRRRRWLQLWAWPASTDRRVAAILTLTSGAWLIAAVPSVTNAKSMVEGLAALSHAPVLPCLVLLVWYFSSRNPATGTGTGTGSSLSGGLYNWAQLVLGRHHSSPQLVLYTFKSLVALLVGIPAFAAVYTSSRLPSSSSAAAAAVSTTLPIAEQNNNNNNKLLLHGLLSLAGLFLFLSDSVPPNPYARHAPHSYGPDAIRIVLPTTHHEGTVYVLPDLTLDSDRGFDAVWSPKIPDEHRAADGQIMTLFGRMRSNQWSPSEPLERLRETLAQFYKRVALDGSCLETEHVERLARWIYSPLLTTRDKAKEDQKTSWKIDCLRAPGAHLIGRDLMFALCHAEYIVLMAQGQLSPETRSKLGTLRLMTRSGAAATTAKQSAAGDKVDHEAVGYANAGYVGYRDAVEHVYALFGLSSSEIDESALKFRGVQPPRFSHALDGSPDTIDEYVADLWDLACRYSESTFSALWFFTTVWFMENGNVNGFHIFPLRCRSQDADQISQHVVLRQLLWAGCVSQLVSVSPVLFGAFVAGFMSWTL